MKAESGKWKAGWLGCLAVAFLVSPSLAEDKPAAPKFTTETLRGRVVVVEFWTYG